MRLAPVMEQLEGEYRGRLKIVSANVEDAGDTASELGIMGLPTLVFYKGGREVHRIVGGVDRSRLVKAIKDNMGI